MKKKKIPPSKARYNEKNPIVSFHLPKEIKVKLEAKIKREGKTKSQFLCDFFTNLVEEDVKEEQIIDERINAAYNQGFDMARAQYEIKYRCLNCNRIFTILPKSQLYKDFESIGIIYCSNCYGRSSSLHPGRHPSH